MLSIFVREVNNIVIAWRLVYNMSENKRKVGKEGEELACDYLRKNHYKIICTNFYTKFGEIDIIARQGEYLVFCEVKYRADKKSGHPLESVGTLKQKKIVKSSLFYIKRNGLSMDTPIRFDVVSITGDRVSVIKNAFEGFDL